MSGFVPFARTPRSICASLAVLEFSHHGVMVRKQMLEVFMTRVRLTADVAPELRRRVKVAAASADRSISEWIEGAVRRELEVQEREHRHSGGREVGDEDVGEMTDHDRAWLSSDVSHLGKFEPYGWQEGELEEGRPLRYEPGVGIVVEGGKERRSRRRE